MSSHPPVIISITLVQKAIVFYWVTTNITTATVIIIIIVIVIVMNHSARDTTPFKSQVLSCLTLKQLFSQQLKSYYC